MTERKFAERRYAWLRQQGHAVLTSTALNSHLQDAIRLNSDDISNSLLTAIQSRIWEDGIGEFRDVADRCVVHKASSMQEWVEADWGLNMTMAQLFRTVANRRMEDSAATTAKLLIEATPPETLQLLADKGQYDGKDMPGWRQIIRANEDAYGSQWREVSNALDDSIQRQPGGNGNNQLADKKAIPGGNRNFTVVSSKSREGRRRTLRRYAQDAQLCEVKGVKQNQVIEALRGFEEGELTATAAMRAAGLLSGRDSSTNRVFLVRDSKEVARRLISAAGSSRAMEIAQAILQEVGQ